MKKMNKKGFTLIELLAVIVILAIVAAVTMTVVVPMISGKNEDGAITSAKEINKAIANACSADGLDADENPYGKLTGYSADCATDTSCTITKTGTEAADFVKALNISGDMPGYVTVTIKNCQVSTADYCYNSGSFSKLKVNTNSGVVTAAEFTSGAADCGGITY